MRILLADNLPTLTASRLSELGFEVISNPSLKEASLVAALGEVDPNVLVVRSTRVNAEHIEAASSLSLVIRAGAGVNTIDRDACSKRGVFVTNCPGKNADAVAELTLGLILAIDRSIPDNVADLRQGQWDKQRYSKSQGLKGRKLGVLGTGKIGTGVIQRALAFEMEVFAWSRSLTVARARTLGVHWCESPRALAEKVDILSIHLALHKDTHKIIDASIIEGLKPGSLLINTARAEVLDEEALLARIDSQNLRVGLDVFTDEPSAKQAPFEHPLAQHPRVYGTHHIAASTNQAQEAVAAEVVRIVDHYARSGNALNCVNLTATTEADHCLLIRHRDRVGVLAEVLKVLRGANINVQEMENTIFQGGEAASARIQVSGEPSTEVLRHIRASEDVFHVSVVIISSTGS
jgi:D-3-phosphoglycerate dehydrogenase